MEVALTPSGPWHRVVDYRKHLCRSWQTLYFPARIIRCIRVVGTRSTLGQCLHLIVFQCFYTREQFSIQNDLLVSLTDSFWLSINCSMCNYDITVRLMLR